MDPDGSNVKLLTTEAGNAFYPSFAPDGTRILFEAAREEPQRALYTMDAAGGLVTRISTAGKAFEDRQARFSCDAVMSRKTISSAPSSW
jgi:Tol biopolymer transport system component